MLGEKPTKCCVPTCPNHSDAGGGLWIRGMYNHETEKNKIREDDINSAFICMPCLRTVLGKGDKHSWLYKSCTGFKDANKP